MRITAIILLLVTGLNALAAGYAFIDTPDGSALRIPTSYLRRGPFTDFLIPGIVLFVVIGLGSMLVAWLGIRRHRAFPGALLSLGCLLCGWIGIQMWIVQDFNWLHAACGLIGLAWIWMGLRLRRQNV